MFGSLSFSDSEAAPNHVHPRLEVEVVGKNVRTGLHGTLWGLWGKGAGRAATALLGAASYRGMARSPAATATCPGTRSA